MKSKDLPKEESRSVADMIRQRRRQGKKLSFAGISESGKRDVSEKHEKLLWRKNL